MQTDSRTEQISISYWRMIFHKILLKRNVAIQILTLLVCLMSKISRNWSTIHHIISCFHMCFLLFLVPAGLSYYPRRVLLSPLLTSPNLNTRENTWWKNTCDVVLSTRSKFSTIRVSTSFQSGLQNWNDDSKLGIM